MGTRVRVEVSTRCGAGTRAGTGAASAPGPCGDTVPLNRPAESLAPGPRGAVQARRWVAGVCDEIGRPELRENAELALSEVVTNAILHGHPPVTVRLRGTRSHPRVEVRDASTDPPALPSARGRTGVPRRAPHLRPWARHRGQLQRGLGRRARRRGQAGLVRPGLEPSLRAGARRPPRLGRRRRRAVVRRQRGDGRPPAARAGRAVAGHARPRRGAAPRAPPARPRPSGHLPGRLRPLGRSSPPWPATSADSSVARPCSPPCRPVSPTSTSTSRHRPTPSSGSSGCSSCSTSPTRSAATSGCSRSRASPEQVAFQNWLFGEFVRQADGDDPTPWRDADLPSSSASAVAELVQPVVVDPEVVGDLVHDGDPHLARPARSGLGTSRAADGGRS